jgi:hypothetical protein
MAGDIDADFTHALDCFWPQRGPSMLDSIRARGRPVQ